MRTGHADLSLHSGHAPRWLFERMTGLARETSLAVVAVPGVGAKGLCALALVAELAYGEPASIRDPVSYAFANGGKDGTPFPVDRATYDATIESLRRAVAEARAGRTEKVRALKRLAALSPAR